MTDRLSGPTFEPIYELDECIDSVEGYDHLQLAVHALAAHYPKDEYHLALERATQASLAACRREEVDETIAIRARLRRSSIRTKIVKEGGIGEAIAERSVRFNTVRKIQKAAQEHLAAFFEETGLESHDVMQSITELEIDKAKQKLQEAQAAVEQREATVEHARAILNRRFDRVAPLPETADPAERETVTDPAALGFNRVAAIMRLSKNGLLLEHRLVKALYPDLYATDRPAAYRQFDEMFDQFAGLSQHFTATHGFMQKGTIHRANESGRPVDNRLGAVYRSIGNDQEEIILSAGGMQQRVTLSGTPHVIVWEGVTPQHSIRRRQVL
jgi:hypothetical protein